MFKKATFLSLICLSTIFSIQASDKVYIDEEEINFKQDAFYIHKGGNIWINTNTVHRDETGLYTYEQNIKRSLNHKSEYEKKWKCPYCHQYWPIGSACKNKECPSKYK